MEGVEYFGVIDYLVFALMLLMSAAIGVYFAYFAKTKQDTPDEYLMGGKNMGIFPISMSLIASSISGIALLGIPSEMYVYGSQYWIGMFGDCIGYLIAGYFYLPVFFTLQLTSTYAYLAKRYNNTVRVLGSICFLLGATLYMPIVIYVPALSLSQVTGMSLYVLIPIICVVCIFYTTLGGLKAVVWTDTLQTILMLLAAIIVVILGVVKVGGFDMIWQRNLDGDRIEFFNMDLNPGIRHTFWNMIFGRTFMTLAGCAVNQAIIQRCLAMPTLQKSRMTLIITCVGFIVTLSLCCYIGLVVYATFYDCDPLLSGSIRKYDQLLPFYVLRIAKNVPGLPGIFVAGVFSASLSTMSTALNSMTGVIFEDFIKPFLKTPMSDQRQSFWMKVMVVVCGVVTTALALVVDKLGGLIQTTASLTSISFGPLLGVFTMGMTLPWVTSLGALIGGVFGTLFLGWIAIGTQIAIAKKQMTYIRKPIGDYGCPVQNLTTLFTTSSTTMIPSTTTMVPDVGEPLALYKVSYTYYMLIGMLTTIIVGVIASFIFGANDPHDIDEELLTPFVHRFYKKYRKNKRYSVNDEMKKMNQNGALKETLYEKVDVER